MRDCGVPNLPHGTQHPIRQHVSTAIGFSRPHTIVGTVVSLCALFVVARAVATAADPGLVDASAADLGLALVAGLGVNVFIVGLNQLTDVSLDRVNKPWLPLACGAMTPTAARLVVGTALVVALVAGAAGGPWLLAAIVIAAALGAAYSLQPLRLKRYHPLAAGCIVAVRGIVVNLLVFAHYTAAPGTGLPLPPALVALTAVALVTGLVIAWFKDLGDMEGDRQHAVGTLPLRLGAPRVVTLGVGALLVTYAAVAVAGVVGVPGLHRGVLAGGHTALAVRLVLAVRTLDTGDEGSVARFYRTIWVLFCAAYGVFAAAAVVA